MFEDSKRRRALGIGEDPRAPGGRVRASELRKAQWLAAMRWRRRASRACKSVGLTFTQWLFLDALRELYEETHEAATQSEIAARVELDRATATQVMRALEDKGLVDREGGWKRTWLVFPSEKAEAVLLRLYPLLAAASVRVTESPRARPESGNR